MNERIKELAIQADAATIIFDREGHYHIIKPEIQKFAELIVRECAVIATEGNSDKISLEILQHFGVEE